MNKMHGQWGGQTKGTNRARDRETDRKGGQRKIKNVSYKLL